MKKRHVIVVGGGASGLVAAISAARQGATVTLVEQKERLGKKILSTGNGRCNLTNTYMDTQCFRGDDSEIVRQVLDAFGTQETIQFFEDLGVLIKERQGYCYPLSDQASTILDVLRMEVENLQIQVEVGEAVKEIRKKKAMFFVRTESKTITGDAVILATGGKAAQALGSDGSGYQLAKSFGHHLSPVVPALVQLKGSGDYFRGVSGVRMQAKVSLFVERELKGSDTGELQWTDYGISGIPVFQISRFAAKALQEKKEAVAYIDLLPNISEDDFYTLLKERVQTHGKKTMELFLVGIFHKKIISMLLNKSAIPHGISAEQIKEEKWHTFVRLCKQFEIPIIDTNGFPHAQVCAGGVRTTEINPETMESIYEKGLYFTGELMDVDGICGGYNLQWAWATGHIAGKFAAKGN